MSLYMRFHIKVKKGKIERRTTVSVESVLAELFSFKLGFDIETPEGHRAVRLWLQEKQDEQKMSNADSALLKQSMILEISDRKLSEKYWKKRSDKL